jgi:hypothetical protein
VTIATLYAVAVLAFFGIWKQLGNKSSAHPQVLTKRMKTYGPGKADGRDLTASWISFLTQILGI